MNTPTRYLSTNIAPSALTCPTCDGVGRVRRGPGDYADCSATGCKDGKVAPPAGAPRLWRVIGFGACPECRDGDLSAALVSWGRVDQTTLRTDIPVWNGDEGTFTTLGAIE